MSTDRFGGDKLEVMRFEAEVNGHKMVAGIQPKCGANLVSLNVDGNEYLHYDEEALRGPEELYTGCFIMFPTPCRIPDGTYEFRGRRITQTKSGRLITIHGLVRDEAFAFEIANGVAAGRLEIAPGHPVYEGFPFPGLLTVELTLVERGLEYHFCFENRSDVPAPVGFGLHSFWRVPGRREDVYIRIPYDQAMLMENLIPNGKVERVAGTDLDLREPRSLAELAIDNAFTGRIGMENGFVEYRDLGKRMVLHADEIFTHQIGYCPAGQPFACVENLTCAPNAVNLQDVPQEISGFRILEPGQCFSGTTRYIVEDL